MKITRSLLSSMTALHKVTGKCIYGVGLNPTMFFMQEPPPDSQVKAFCFDRCPICGKELNDTRQGD